MNKKYLNIIIIILTLFLMYQVIINKFLVYNSISFALNIWVDNLIPSLFPFFIISNILINYNFTCYIPKKIKEICKRLFNITDNMLTILILSMLSGFPNNARNTRILYDKKLITLDEANHILIFSHFANPSFILTTVGIFFFNNSFIGIILLISHYLSNFILGIFFRNFFTHEKINNYKTDNKINFGNVFIDSINKSVDTILLICGIVTVFLLISSLINNIFNFNLYNLTIIKGILEITIGIESLSSLNLPMIYKCVIASCFLAFGGFSVHTQVISQINETNISYKYFFIGRIYQMIISGLITYLICFFLM